MSVRRRTFRLAGAAFAFSPPFLGSLRHSVFKGRRGSKAGAMEQIFDGYFRSSKGTSGFRWHDCAKPGKWIVSVTGGSDGFYATAIFDAVVDDFGNLVKVAR